MKRISRVFPWEMTYPALVDQSRQRSGRSHDHAHDRQEKATSEVVHTNQKHPFLTVEKGFLPVGQIKIGMHVVKADGQVGVITGWKAVPGVQTMYNLEVAQDHTFTVGMGQWVVHNCAMPPTLSVDKTTIVIGETLTRVEQGAADLLEAGFEDVRTYVAKDDEPTVAANRAWLRYWVKEKGAQVVTVGEDTLRVNKSEYYLMEERMLGKWGVKPFSYKLPLLKKV